MPTVFKYILDNKSEGSGLFVFLREVLHSLAGFIGGLHCHSPKMSQYLCRQRGYRIHIYQVGTVGGGNASHVQGLPFRGVPYRIKLYYTAWY